MACLCAWFYRASRYQEILIVSFKKIRTYCVAIIVLLVISFALPQLFHIHKGNSISIGTRFNGSLENGYLLPYSGENFQSFSWISYYLMDNAYVHNKVGEVVLEAYEDLEETFPENHYVYMECSDQYGGRLNFHRSHRNGLSIDFMCPKVKDSQPYTKLDNLGFAHYFLEFDTAGVLLLKYPYLERLSMRMAVMFTRLFLEPNVSIDYERIAQHLLALQKATEGSTVFIKKVIFKIDLKKKLFKGVYGKKLLQSGVPFATQLNKTTNDMHDEHYHIDFQLKE